MTILPIEELKIDYNKIREIDEVVKSTFRLIIFNRDYFADDLLNAFLRSTLDLQELLCIKNSQLEAQTEQEVEEYLISFRNTLKFIIGEIKSKRDFTHEEQLFQLIRLISNNTHIAQPNKYRTQLVKIGRYNSYPTPVEISPLVSQLLYNINRIKNPIIRAIYFHHEFSRIHPFMDGNGRATRIAENWILMYDLYPPVFIRDEKEKKEYKKTLSNSFLELNKNPNQWNMYLQFFFNQEMNRILVNAKSVFKSVDELVRVRET